MYKLPNYALNKNLILVRKQLCDGTCSALIVVRAPRHRYSQDAKYSVPPKPPKPNKLLWGTVGATLLTGAAVVYAKNSPDARNWIESNLPWANDFIALVYQENTTYWKFTTNQLNKITTSLVHFLFGREGVTPPDYPMRYNQDLERDAALALKKKDYELPPPAFEPLYEEKPKLGTPQIETEAIVVQTDKCEPQSQPPIKITKDMVELEHEMHENTKAAIDSYKKATKYYVNYNKALFAIIESPVESLDKNSFASLKSSQSERDKAAVKAKEATANARCAIETLSRMIAAGVQAPPETIAATQRYIRQFRKDLDDAEADFKAEESKANISNKYWNKVQDARNAYKEELEMLFPGVDIKARNLELRGDTDLLLLYTLKQIQFLQNALAELQTVRELKINRAIECHDEKAIIEAKVEDIVKKEKLEMEKQYLKKALEIESEANKHMKDQLKKQYEIQQEVMQDRLAKKEREISAKLNRVVYEQVEKERVEFKRELAAMAGKLQAIEYTLKQRAGAEAAAKRSQSLWAAAEALSSATRRSQYTASIRDEIKALENAGKDDKLVLTILKAIPEDVREKGIATEKALREQFDQMEQSAFKVALVGKEGASLPVYFLSWVQSKLLFQRFAKIPQDELDNLPQDFTKLDTFDIMQRARYHMERGDVANAVRCVGLSRGAARAAACPWLCAARAHLEVRAAADALAAHAAAAAMLHL